MTADARGRRPNGEAVAALFAQLDERLTRFEDSIDKRFTRLEGKLEARAEWEKDIELRLAALEGGYRLATWVLGTITVIILTGTLAFGWALLSNRIDIIDHQTSTIVVTATPHP